MAKRIRRMLVVASVVAVSTLGGCLPDRNYGLIVISQQPVIERVAEIEHQAGRPVIESPTM